VPTAIQDVEHWDRKRQGLLFSRVRQLGYVSVQGDLLGRGRCPRDGKRNCENRIGSQSGFIQRRVGAAHRGIKFSLIEYVLTNSQRTQDLVNV